MGEGYWFWVIPLQGKTSLGLVYDHTIFPRERVATPQKLMAWVCQEFPLFARDLPSRKILDHGSFKDFSYGCVQTIHPSRWALSGEAGRFTDPLYSPGSDFIGFYNTLITDAILTTDAQGRYRFKTIKPAAYPAGPDRMRPAHIHFQVSGRQDKIVTQMYFEGDPYNNADPFLNSVGGAERQALLVKKLLDPSPDYEPGSKMVIFDIVLYKGVCLR